MANKSFSVREFDIVGNTGNSKLTSTEYIELNTPRVAISTDLTVGGTVRSNISLPAHSLTALQANITGVTTISSVNVVGVCTAASFVGDGSGLTNLPGGGGGSYGNSDVDTHLNVSGASSGEILSWNGSDYAWVADQTGGGATQNFSGIVTATSFQGNSVVGDGSDRGFTQKYYITSNGASGYRFAGPGLVNTTDNPTLYLQRGFTYIFENSTGSGHPFALRVSSGGSNYSPGTNFLTGSQNGTQILTVPFDAPNSIVYQCTLHSGMLGTINFPT